VGEYVCPESNVQWATKRLHDEWCWYHGIKARRLREEIERFKCREKAGKGAGAEEG
jgi:hypothetical protein